jgi:hypothetical protein
MDNGGVDIDILIFLLVLSEPDDNDGCSSVKPVQHNVVVDKTKNRKS